MQTIREAARANGVPIKPRTAYRVGAAARVRRFGHTGEVSKLRPYLRLMRRGDVNTHFVVEAVQVLDDGSHKQVVETPASTVAQLEASRGSTEHLVRAAVVFGWSVRLAASDALGGMKYMLTCDGAHTASGKLLTLVASDANDHLIPLALAWVKSESTDSWNFFFNSVTDAMPAFSSGSTDPTGHTRKLVLMADGSAAISKAVSESLPESHRVRCIQHRLRNLARKFSKHEHAADIFKHVTNLAYSKTTVKFDAADHRLLATSTSARDYVHAVRATEWAQAKLPSNCHTFGSLTNNNSGEFGRPLEPGLVGGAVTYHTAARTRARGVQLRRETAPRKQRGH